MGWKLDTNERSQVQATAANRRSIYDASRSEIFWKSILAGFALGLGQTLATVLFFGVIAGLLITMIGPFLTQLGVPLDELEVVLQQRVQPFTSMTSPVPSAAVTTSPTATTSTVVGE